MVGVLRTLLGRQVCLQASSSLKAMFAWTRSEHCDAFDFKPGPEGCAVDDTSGREVPSHPDNLGSVDAACSSLGLCSEGERPILFAPGKD